MEKSQAVGILQIEKGGYGFLRQELGVSSESDVYVPPIQIKRFGLQPGDKIKCSTTQFPGRPAPSLVFIHEVNDVSCMHSVSKQNSFDNLKAVYPTQQLKLEVSKDELTLRLIDLIAPLGKGQRGLIVAPPKSGKTILLKRIANAISKNHPDVQLNLLLVAERPEEIEEFKDIPNCHLVYSTFDQPVEMHINVAEGLFSNARRRVECGQDVVVLMDGVSRLVRAYNQARDNSALSALDNFDIRSLQEPKKLFASGRKVAEGGSLTVLATVSTNTDFVDEVIFREFISVSNVEIYLEENPTDLRLFPSIDVSKSRTLRDDLLVSKEHFEVISRLRKELNKANPTLPFVELVDIMKYTPTNKELIETFKILNKEKVL
ncbi:MAG: transcription termination factor Rho [Clostridia bacterium]|nr:transcription termination factor Rho [Clostridia bacterium]